MRAEMEIHGHDIPKWLGAIIGFFVFLGGLFRMFFVIKHTIDDHEERLEAHDKKLAIWSTGYLKKVAETDLHDLMTEKHHTTACKTTHAYIGQKIEEVRACVSDGHDKLADRMDRMDKLREDSKAEAIKRDIAIAKTLGRVEEHLARDK